MSAEQRRRPGRALTGSTTRRLALINALTIAKMTGRILLVPPITLGAAVAWVPPPLLQEHIERAENSNIHDCRETPVQLRKERVRSTIMRQREGRADGTKMHSAGCFGSRVAPAGRGSSAPTPSPGGSHSLSDHTTTVRGSRPRSRSRTRRSSASRTRTAARTESSTRTTRTT